MKVRRYSLGALGWAGLENRQVRGTSRIVLIEVIGRGMSGCSLTVT